MAAAETGAALVSHAGSDGGIKPRAHVQETKQVFEKLYKFVGKNIKALVDRPDEPYCFRLQKNRVYYVRESLMKKATNVRVEAWRGGHGAGMVAHHSAWHAPVEANRHPDGTPHTPPLPAPPLLADCTREACVSRDMHRENDTHRKVQALSGRP